MTERKMATIRKIDNIEPIDGADLIQVATIGGWKVVIKKDEYKIGDLAIYFEIDSWIPTELAPFLSKGSEPRVYNGVKGEKLKTIRLKKQISQGLLLPTSIRGQFFEAKTVALLEGADVTEELHIQKYEAPISANLAGLAKGNFPSFGRKTDQERIENLIHDVFVENKDSRFEISLKLDGSSCSVYYYDAEIGVCSRNLNLKLTEENASNTFVSTAKISGLIDALSRLGKNIMVSMELMGPNIQGNKENLKAHDLYVFDIFDISLQEYATPANRIEIFNKLRDLGFTGKHVPIIESGVTLSDIGVTDVASSKTFVDRPSIGSSIAEGCVFKRVDGKFSFKSINNKFLLKFE